ncbi:MAG: hypothetical protein OCU12_08105 [Methanophagales archaeon]|nr:hypothetical protein [Methanophagales archaeon]
MSPGRVEVHQRFHTDQNVAGNLTQATVVDLQAEFWYWLQVRYVDKFGQTTAWMLTQHQAPTVAGP